MRTDKHKSICADCFWPLTPLVEQGICRKPDSPVLYPRGVEETYCVAKKEAPPFMTMSEAMAHAIKYFRITVTRPTLISWCKTRGIGRQIGGGVGKNLGRWHIYNLIKFREILHGED